MAFWIWVLVAIVSLILFLNYLFKSLAVPHESWSFCFFSWFRWYRRRLGGNWYFFSFDEFDCGTPIGHRHVCYWTQAEPQLIEMHRVRRRETYTR